MDKDKPQSLNELLLADKNQQTRKACTLGLVIDCSGVSRLENGEFMRKIKIIDESLNQDKSSFSFKYCFCTVMFFADSEDSLPEPRCIGDILYLRRFNFERWNQQFQAKASYKNISSWALLCGESTSGIHDYQKSKPDMILEDQKYNSIRPVARELRVFARKYIESHSIIKALSPGVNTKDEDYVVRLVRKLENGSLIINEGTQNWVINDTYTTMQEGDIGKLRSVARVAKEGTQTIVYKNNFTSLVKLPEWSSDAQSYLKKQNLIEDEDDNIYTPLNELAVKPAKQLQGKVFNVKCEIFRITQNSFKSAIQFYQQGKNAVHDSNKKGCTPIYRVEILCSDSSLPEKKAIDLHVFSFDGQCSNFVPQVDLSHDYSELSSFIQEEQLFKERYDQLLQAEAVKMKVECRTDGKNNKLFRVLEINC